MTTRLKILLAFFLGASLMLLTCNATHSPSGWKQELKQDLDGCIVENVQYHNAFVKVQMTCNYFDGVVIGKSMQTLYVSPKGYVIKRGW